MRHFVPNGGIVIASFFLIDVYVSIHIKPYAINIMRSFAASSQEEKRAVDGGEKDHPYPEIRPWVRRLFDARGVQAPEKRLDWMGVQLERFLTWCRKQVNRGEVDGMSVGYLESLREARVPDWQIAQASQALHAFSTGIENWHWLESGSDIRTVQELLGHKDVSTTMICTHVMQKPGVGAKSPLSCKSC